MNHYRQSIILFGFVLPLLVVGVVSGGAAWFRGKIAASFQDKSRHYASYEVNRLQALEAEERVKREREHVALWTETLREETASLVTSHLRRISAELPSREFQQTSFNRPNSNSGFGSVAAQKSAPLELSFRANFRSMQRAFLDLESRLPQLQLQDLKIDRTPQSQNLNFQVTYTAWEE